MAKRWPVPQRIYVAVSGLIFDLVFLLHVLRIIFGWRAEIGEFEVPMWISWVSLVVVGYLAVSAYLLLKR
jgi:Mn2+/Fe2+ NRAMP family transporter